MRKTLFYLCVFLPLMTAACAAADQAKSAAVSPRTVAPIKKAIYEAQDEKSIARGIESAEELYLKENRFDEYVAFLKSLERRDRLGKSLISFSIGQARLMQLKYLEESQQWEQYFNLGAGLRKEAVESLTKSRENAFAGNAVALYADLLLWQYHRDQQDGGEAASLDSLAADVKEYTEAGQDPEPLKKAAEVFSAYGEKGKAREYYDLYFRKFASQEMNDETLLSASMGFLAEGNIDLAESAFDLYAERMGKDAGEKAVPAFLQIGKALAYREKQPVDPEYAEKMFAAAESAGGDAVFDEDTLYLRAFNLEKGCDLGKACDMYIRLAEKFPAGKYRPEALFKAGVITAYVRRDIPGGRSYFERVAAIEPAGSHSVAALYQLGLLKQWEQDIPAAKELYAKAVEKAGEAYPETAALAGTRLEEIESSKPIDFPLRVFLENTFDEARKMEMTKAGISSPGSSLKAEDIPVASGAAPDPSGCTQVTLSHYWSGYLGSRDPEGQASFQTSYREPGTKVINLVVMTPSGALDRAIKMIDIK